ncbi:putative AP2/B3-like transcriptional factor family protein [Hibiscus syriacus]|uniref:AP2/B3-like transcriptional factor family protein n=1 Tax=Hibiscus syriacus TaxID=106335 RepID=A0A6A2ZII9_HIBSY|nr:WEB family protein At1g75720-like [Hibiscus syriacus]KAE8690755.1 putative AP2/B3-like transcriptional factor family protein [Hibiscus syriacus]
MDTQVPVPAATEPPKNYRSNVDTSRPFRTVKEAVAVFSERFLVGEIYTPKPYTYSRPPSQEVAWFSPGSTPLSRKQDDQREVLDTLKKLETELEETKAELKLLKERESETEIVLASLNAELHKNMSKLAIAEAAAAKNAAETTPTPRTASLEMGKGEDIAREEERRKELMKRMENNPTLSQSQIPSIGEKEGHFGGKRERKLMKKKPIVPLLGDWIFKKKRSPTTLHNPLYVS